MRTLLLFPPTTVYGDDPSVPPVTQPLGLAYLAAYLEQEGHIVKVLDDRGGRENKTQTPTYTRFAIPDKEILKIEYSGNAVDYWHDFTTSICKCFSTKVPIINKVFYFMFFPIGFTIRTLLSIFIAQTAELNTYVVKNSS